jgi:hypothetical protein
VQVRFPWQQDDVLAGGLVAGHVRDRNTGSGVPGASLATPGSGTAVVSLTTC